MTWIITSRQALYNVFVLLMHIPIITVPVNGVRLALAHGLSSWAFLVVAIWVGIVYFACFRAKEIVVSIKHKNVLIVYQAYWSVRKVSLLRVQRLTAISAPREYTTTFREQIEWSLSCCLDDGSVVLISRNLGHKDAIAIAGKCARLFGVECTWIRPDAQTGAKV